jgi:hypothetical protein
MNKPQPVPEGTAYAHVPTSPWQIENFVRLALREVRLSYAFVWRDLPSTMVPTLLFTASALHASPHISSGMAFLALGRAS